MLLNKTYKENYWGEGNLRVRHYKWKTEELISGLYINDLLKGVGSSHSRLSLLNHLIS